MMGYSKVFGSGACCSVCFIDQKEIQNPYKTDFVRRTDALRKQKLCLVKSIINDKEMRTIRNDLGVVADLMFTSVRNLDITSLYTPDIQKEKSVKSTEKTSIKGIFIEISRSSR